MKIKSIETFTRNNIGVVRVTTEDGHVGYGQMAPYHADISTIVLHQQISPSALRLDFEDPLELVETLIELEHKFQGSYVCRAVGGLDTALWDLMGKRTGKSVSELCGTPKRELEVYGSSMRRDILPREEAERLYRLSQESGFRAFKIRIGKKFGHDEDMWPGRTDEIVPTVRRAIGDGIRLFVDANSGYSPKKAIEVGKMLEQYGVQHFEEPCPFQEIEWTKQVTDALNLSVAGGEQDHCTAQWRRMIAMRAVDIVQPDVCYVGGFSRARRVARMAEEAGLVCMPHAANLSMVAVFTAHLVAVIPNAGEFMEWCIEPLPWTKEFFKEPLQIRDGKFKLPEGPGWGVEISQDWLSNAAYRISQL